MKWNKSKIILIIEFILIMLPVSVLFLLGSYFIVPIAFKAPEINNIINAIFSITFALSISAVYILGYRVLNDKTSSFFEKPFLWLLITTGLLIVLSSLISAVTPFYLPYTLLWYTRQNLEFFIFGSPLIIVVIHLYYEVNKR